jgi:hypothetical protein
MPLFTKYAHAIGPVREQPGGGFAWTVTDLDDVQHRHRTSARGDGIFGVVDDLLYGPQLCQIAGHADIDLSGVTAKVRRRRLEEWYGVNNRNAR